MADFLTLNTKKQSKVNRIWRFLNKSKLFKPINIYKAIIKIVFSIYKVDQVVIDFTSLDGYNIKLFIASVPFKSRSIPIFCKSLFLSDIKKMKYKSENQFIIEQIDELIKLIPRNITILADRQFATKQFIKMFIEKNVNFVMRIRERVKIKINGEELLIKDLKEGKYEIEIEGEKCFLYKKEDKKDNLVIISNKDIGKLKNAMRIYKRRSLCENMHRDLKSKLDLLFLNKKYYREMNEEKVDKYLVLFVLSHTLSMIIGYIGMKNKEIYRSFISKGDEKSLFNLGQLLILIDNWESLLIMWLNKKYKYLLSDYR